MIVKRKIIEIDEERCDGCGVCAPSCAEGAIQIIDGKARLVEDRYCDGLGACLGECPNDALRIVEREAEDFDEEAVHEYLQEKEQAEHTEPEGETLACGCPSAHLQTFETISACDRANQPVSTGSDAVSQLSHWPVQIRLVPPTAPFLKGADILVAADCTAVACANFHRDFLAGKVVLMGCPKFDDAQAYVQKFSEIFKKADIKSVTVLVMEVPCCSGLPMIVQKGMEASGKRIPMERVVVSTRGDVLNRDKLVA